MVLIGQGQGSPPSQSSLGEVEPVGCSYHWTRLEMSLGKAKSGSKCCPHRLGERYHHSSSASSGESLSLETGWLTSGKYGLATEKKKQDTLASASTNTGGSCCGG